MPLPWLLSLLALADPTSPLVHAARAQVGVTTTYDGQYVRLSYPGGDLPMDRGVCTDVVIRALRAQGFDLQQRVHEDMRSAWKDYPNPWKLKGPDRNIDHRRVPNLATFFTRHGQVLPVSRDPKAYAPGDLVTWRLSKGLPHIGVVSDRKTPDGVPLVIHNIGEGVKEEDLLFQFPITGHFRYPR